MQLREIHIDGFGIICDKHVTGISTGINVLYGPNEFGKSTLLEFVRRILFGFRGTNSYPALAGGAYGGRLVCELKNGTSITISRKEGRSGGPVNISLDSGDLSGQEELNKILGPINQKFYNNIYAIGLDDLQTIQTLEEEEIKNHIYGAGLGLGNTSLKDIKDTFLKQSEIIFKPRGSAQLMPALYEDIREKEKVIKEATKHLSEYDGLVKQRDELQAAIKSLIVEIVELETEQRRLQTQQKLFPTYVILKEKETLFSEIPETPLFYESALADFEKLEIVSSNMELQTKRDMDDLEQQVQTRSRFVFDDTIIGLEPSIVSLQKKSDQFRSASRDITAVISERTSLVNKTGAKIERLGQGWTEERVRCLNLNILQKDQIRIANEEINDAKRSVESIRSKLEAHRDSRAAESSRGIHIPTFIKNTGYVSIALGVIGIILGFAISQPLLSVFPACLLIAGLIVVATARKASKTPASDPLEKKYADDLSTAELNHKKVSGIWQGQLKEISFDKSLSPEGVLDFMRTVGEIQLDLASVSHLDSRIKSMQDTIDIVNKLLNEVLASLGKTKLSDDTIASIEILTKQLDSAKEMKSKKESSEERITELNRKMKIDRDNENGAREELLQYISTFGAKDKADFRKKYDIFRSRETLRKVIDDSKTTIRQVVGTGKDYESFITSMSLTNPAAIAAALETTESRKKGLETERDNKNQTIGELSSKIKDLSSEDLITKQTELETKKQQLRDHSADWVKSKIALFVLNKAISKYETTRQPEVIKAAAEVFTRITNNAYSTVIKSAELNSGETAELLIQDSSAKRKRISEMSRGTKEQLYLAMRLGLIKVYEAESEPMPIIMDDILANFDDNRGPEAIKTLIEFSNDKQVIVLTCHSNNFNLYKSLGAKEIRFG